jgi:Polymer-forming cytoskeletal
MRKVGFTLVLALLLLSFAATVAADGPEGDVVIFGKNYTLDSGQRIKGDLQVFGGNVTLETGSTVDGHVAVFGGNVVMAGEVAGDVTVWGGSVSLRSTADVRGDVVCVGGSVDRAEGAQVRGDLVDGWPLSRNRGEMPRIAGPVMPQVPRVNLHRSWGSDTFRGIGDLFRSVFGIVVMVVLGILVVVFLPRHTETVAETMVKGPVQSLVVGLASAVGGSVLLIVLSLIAALLVATICLSPVGLLLLLPWLVAGVALLFGWISAGLLLGVKVLRAITHKEPNRVAGVAVGIPLLTVVSYIPCVGWLAAALVVIWSLGAVVYSLFGTRPAGSVSPWPGTKPRAAAATPDTDPRLDQL